MKQEIYEYSLNETLAIKDEIEKRLFYKNLKKRKKRC